jgi:hypothetical protein
MWEVWGGGGGIASTMHTPLIFIFEDPHQPFFKVANILRKCSAPNNYLVRPGLPAAPRMVDLLKPRPRYK